MKPLLGVICISLLCWSCGGGSSSGGSNTNTSTGTVTSLTLEPSGAVIQTGQRFIFTAIILGTPNFNPAVTWTVNGVVGGNALNGTIASDGTYIAPAATPATDPITITATSVSDSTKSASVTATIFGIDISPLNPTMQYGQTQQFTATVTGVNNSGIQWSSFAGQINSSGFYSAPPESAPIPETDKITATLAGVGASSVTVNIQPIPPKLDSITPSQAVVGQTVVFNAENLFNVTNVFFPMANGNVVPGTIVAGTSPISVIVPVGAISGPVFMQYTQNSESVNTNSVNFTRLPNIRIRAESNELSSGETTQFSFRALGGTTQNAVEWSADLGTISTDGLYQAPSVSAESFATVTGCFAGTQGCDSLMVHLLPVRITPNEPTTSLGNTVQLNAVQGGMVSPTWSLLAADGSINQTGLFTALSTIAQAGPVPVSANFGNNTVTGSVAVSGGFPGIVDRLWDYVNFSAPGKLGTYVQSVAVSGNRLYCVDQIAPYSPNTSFGAIDVYDITNPHQPVWVDAVDPVSDAPFQTFIYGSNLFTVDSGVGFPAASRISIYNIQSGTPVLASVVAIPDLAFSYVHDGVVYGLGISGVEGGVALPTFPVYTFDVRSGNVIQNEYDLPPPPGIQPLGFFGVTGSGNTLYVSMSNQVGLGSFFSVAAYDTSTTPPTVAWSTLSDAGFSVQVVNQLLFVDDEVRDLSAGSPPPLIANFPGNVEAVQGNQALLAGQLDNFMVLDVSNPANIVVTQNIATQAAENPFFFPRAAWNGNNFFSADGAAGLSVYDVSAPGGPRGEEDENTQIDAQSANVAQIFDQTIQQQTLYAADTGFASDQSSIGGLTIFDASKNVPDPNPLGRLNYSNENGLAIQVSNSTAFLGLSDFLKIVDVSNPASPEEVASLSVPTNALALSGTTLFDGTADGRLVVFDVSNATTPSQIASVSIPGPANNMRIAGNLLFIADGPQGLLIFDVSQPASPILLSQFSLSTPVWDVAPSGTVALLAADARGLVVIDISNPAQVKQLSQTMLPLSNPFPQFTAGSSLNLAISVAVQNELVYVGAMAMPDDEGDVSPAALVTFDFTEPASPRLVGFRRYLGSNIEVITPLGNNLFLAENGIEDEINNSFPYNFIELYDPPLALVRPSVLQGNSRSLTAFLHSKLNRNQKIPAQSEIKNVVRPIGVAAH